MTTFIDPSDFAGVIPGRGRQAAPRALEISKIAKGCPVGKGVLLTLATVKASGKDRAAVRAAIVTGTRLAGWGKVSVQWTDQDQPFVTRLA
jgi:rhamnose utilization protein RhaD (predicted bifunctional aldolase and dehydrogenase)